MRILLLYNDAGHVEPLLRCREVLGSYDILIESHQVFQRDARFLGAAGAGGASPYLSSPCDAVLLHHQLMCEEVAACEKPVVLLEGIDGAQLEKRHWLHRLAGEFER